MPVCKECNSKIITLSSHGDVPAGHLPSVGDFMVCGFCGMIGKFDEEMNSVKCDEDDLDKLMDNNPEMYMQMHSASVLIKKIVKLKGK